MIDLSRSLIAAQGCAPWYALHPCLVAAFGCLTSHRQRNAKGLLRQSRRPLYLAASLRQWRILSGRRVRRGRQVRRERRSRQVPSQPSVWLRVSVLTYIQERQHPMAQGWHGRCRLHLRLSADRHAYRPRIQSRLCHRCASSVCVQTDLVGTEAVSAGFDAADGDDLGECKVTPAGFAHMTHLLASVADGKCVLALEGGYNLDAIANSAVACTQTLLGELPPRMGQLTASSSATEVVALVSREQSRYWSSIRPLHERKEGALALPVLLMFLERSAQTYPRRCSPSRSPVRQLNFL